MKRTLLPLETKNPTWLRFIRLETRDFFFGDHLPLLTQAIYKLFEYDKSSVDLQSFENGIRALIDAENTKLVDYGVSLKLRKGSASEKYQRPYAIRVCRTRRTESLNGISLIEKYSAVQRSKTIELFETSVWFELFKRRRPSSVMLTKYIERRRSTFDPDFQEAFVDITFTLKKWRNRLQLFLKNDPEKGDQSFFNLFGISEVGNAFLASFISASNGFFKESFNGYREILEILELSAFLDVLNFREHELQQNPYANAMLDGWWHKALGGSNKQKLNNIRELTNSLKNKNGIFNFLNTTLLLSLTSRIVCKEHAKRQKLEKYSVSLEELNSSLNKSNTKFAKSLLEQQSKKCDEPKCQNKDLTAVARIPSSQILSYLSVNLIGLDKEQQKKIYRKYDDYSQFVHPYLQTIQYHPFSSDLEVKLWLEETKEFLRLTNSFVEALINVMECSAT
jgi:hypothetical protein